MNPGAAAINPVTGNNDLGLAQRPSIAADGYYTVAKIEFSGDTRGNDWYMDLLMIACKPDGSPIGWIPPQTGPYLGAS